MQRLSLQFKDKPVASIFQQGDSKIVQLSFPAGQTLAKHKAAHTLALMVLQGKIELTVEDEPVSLAALDLVVVDANVEHSVFAIEQSIVALILMPVAATSGHDLAQPHSLEHENAYMNPQLIEQVAEELRPLTRDHIELCKTIDAVQTVSDQGGLHAALQLIDEELKSHFVVEEEYVFPVMALHLGGLDVGPVARLLEEHGKIRKLSSEANQLFEVFARQPDDHVLALLDQKWHELAQALLNHLGKEDSHLFPMASRLFTPEQKQAIGEALRKAL